MSAFPKVVAALIWSLLVGLGFAYAFRYEGSAGTAARQTDWPISSKLQMGHELPTVVLFAHPNCPCTKVGIEQLADTCGHYPDLQQRVKIYVVLVQAPGMSEEIAKSENAMAARRIHGVKVIEDPNGTEAKRFGAKTSGQVFAFTAQRQEVFRGGLTVARGHYGPNDGIDSLTSIFESHAPRVSTTPVYGCSLLGGGALVDKE